MQGRIIFSNIILTAGIAIVSIEHEVARDSSKGNLHHEDKKAVHEISREFTLTNLLSSIVFPVVYTINFVSVVYEDIGDKR